tara:strand:+ start:240 stop:623 length:384 start_codon:yes stop_codon:yes gene_type:complete
MKLSTIREMYDNLLDLEIETTKEERHELLNSLYKESDFCWEAGGAEYRIICEDVIEEIHTEEVKDLTIDCYFNGTDLHKNTWIEIDWEKTAENVRKSDGYGNHFSHYDGSEEEFRLDGVWYYVFRVN